MYVDCRYIEITIENLQLLIQVFFKTYCIVYHRVQRKFNNVIMINQIILALLFSSIKHQPPSIM